VGVHEIRGEALERRQLRAVEADAVELPSRRGGGIGDHPVERAGCLVALCRLDYRVTGSRRQCHERQLLGLIGLQLYLHAERRDGVEREPRRVLG